MVGLQHLIPNVEEEIGAIKKVLIEAPQRKAGAEEQIVSFSLVIWRTVEEGQIASQGDGVVAVSRIWQ